MRILHVRLIEHQVNGEYELFPKGGITIIEDQGGVGIAFCSLSEDYSWTKGIETAKPRIHPYAPGECFDDRLWVMHNDPRLQPLLHAISRYNAKHQGRRLRFATYNRSLHEWRPVFDPINPFCDAVTIGRVRPVAPFDGPIQGQSVDYVMIDDVGISVAVTDARVAQFAQYVRERNDLQFPLPSGHLSCSPSS
jgi:hypothetical protein